MPCIYSLLKNLHLKSGCLRFEEQVVIPNSVKDAYVEVILPNHPCWRMTDRQLVLGCTTWAGILLNASKCNPCIKIVNNLRPWNQPDKWKPLKQCKIPYEENQIDFAEAVENNKYKKLMIGFVERLIETMKCRLACNKSNLWRKRIII